MFMQTQHVHCAIAVKFVIILFSMASRSWEDRKGILWDEHPSPIYQTDRCWSYDSPLVLWSYCVIRVVTDVFNVARPLYNLNPGSEEASYAKIFSRMPRIAESIHLSGWDMVIAFNNPRHTGKNVYSGGHFWHTIQFILGISHIKGIRDNLMSS